MKCLPYVTYSWNHTGMHDTEQLLPGSEINILTSCYCMHHLLHLHQSGQKCCKRKQVYLIGEHLRKKDCIIIFKEIRIQIEYYSANDLRTGFTLFWKRSDVSRGRGSGEWGEWGQWSFNDWNNLAQWVIPENIYTLSQAASVWTPQWPWKFQNTQPPLPPLVLFMFPPCLWNTISIHAPLTNFCFFFLTDLIQE